MRHAAWAIDVARAVATRSKDISTQVGAVVMDERGRIVAAGFNGLPMGVADAAARLNDRAVKYRMIRHAEANALAFAAGRAEGGTLAVTHPCCAQCAGDAIQHGIARVVFPAPGPDMMARWGEDVALAMEMFREAGVEVVEVE